MRLQLFRRQHYVAFRVVLGTEQEGCWVSGHQKHTMISFRSRKEDSGESEDDVVVLFGTRGRDWKR
jgi:hypothetical protein